MSLLRSVLFTLIFIYSGIGFGQNYTQSELDTLIKEAKEVYYASPETSMEMAEDILNLSDSLSYQRGRFEALRLIGNSYYLMGRLDSAAIYMLQLLEQAYDANDYGMQADVMIDIGQTYDKIGLHSLAYDYFRQAHNIRLRIGTVDRLAVTFINLAYHYYLRDELDSALYYYGNTKAILDSIPLNYTTPFLYNELGGVYLKQGKIPEARKSIDKAMELNRQLNNNWDLSFNYVMLAELELSENNIRKAEEYASRALSISEENNIALEYDLIYKILSEVNAKQGRMDAALDYLEMSYSYADSLELALTNQKYLALNNYKQQKESEIANLVLKNENLSQTAQISNQRYILISILAVLFITLFAVGVLFFQNKKLSLAQAKIQEQNSDLRDLNTIKNKLFSIITHDIRNPLSNINGMLKLAKDGHITPDDFNQYAGSLVDQTDKLNDLSETLIKWSRSQQQGMEANLEPVDIDKLIQQSVDYVKYMADNKGVSLLYESRTCNPYKLDPNMMMLVFNNLLTNAIKFTPKEGEILVFIEDDEEKTEIHISDTGIGIEPSLIEDLKAGKVVSNPGTDNEMGTGIGLMLTLDLVTFNGGKLTATKNEISGSTFTITLPRT